jgi:hypothetical protein
LAALLFELGDEVVRLLILGLPLCGLLYTGELDTCFAESVYKAGLLGVGGLADECASATGAINLADLDLLRDWEHVVVAVAPEGLAQVVEALPRFHGCSLVRKLEDDLVLGSCSKELEGFGSEVGDFLSGHSRLLLSCWGKAGALEYVDAFFDSCY